MTSIAALVMVLEKELSDIYGFDLHASANDFMVAGEYGAQIAPLERAAVLIQQDPISDELRLGVYFRQEILAHLESLDPWQSLTQDCLDAFCVLVEELSHFHLISNRALQGQTVSRLELEWQGEIDKVLLAGRLLLRQVGSPCYRQLTHLIFDCAQTWSHESELYEEASRYAARHWYSVMHDVKRLNGRSQCESAGRIFREIYRLPWVSKLTELQKTR